MAIQNLGRVGIVPRGTWSGTTAYAPLDLVAYDGNAWLAKRNNTNVEPNTTNTSDWQLISNNANLVATVQGYKNDAAASASSAADSATAAAASAGYGASAVAGMAPTFNSSTPYVAGSYVWYNAVLYKFTDYHAAGNWIGTDAETAVMGNDIAEIRNQLDGFVEIQPINTTINKSSSSVTTYGTHGYLNISNGAFISDLNYTVYMHTFTQETDIVLSKTGTNGLVGAVLYTTALDTIPTTSTAASAYYIKGCRSDKSDSQAMPDSENPWHATAGQMIAVFVQDVAYTSLNFSLTYSDGYYYKLTNDLELNTSQEERVAEIASGLIDDVEDEIQALSDSIDERFDAVNDEFDDIIVYEPVAKSFDKTSPGITIYATSGYITYNTGIFKTDANYTTYLYTFTQATEIYIEKSGNGLLTADLYNQSVDTIPTGTTAAAAYFVKGSRSDQAAPNALPSASDKWTIPAGYMLILSAQTGGNYNAGFTVHYTGSAPYLSDNLKFNDSQEAEIERIASLVTGGKKPIIKYGPVDTDIGARGKQQITIYLPATSGYIKYAFVRSESNAINSNIWRIDKCYKCDDTLAVLFPITNDGEWEMAIKISGASDFIGGNAHGDEVFTAFHLLIDGVEIEDITALQPQTFKTVQIVETSIMYDPRDGATLETREQYTSVGTHGREYVITDDGIRLLQCVQLDAALTLAASYMTMLPIIRGNDAVSQDQITDHYFANNNFNVYDVSVGESGSAGYGWKSNVTRATIWGETSGISATVEMLKQPEIDNAGARKFQVQSTTDYYNKFYWSICGVNNHNYDASANQRFVTETMFQINAK